LYFYAWVGSDTLEWDYSNEIIILVIAFTNLPIKNIFITLFFYKKMALQAKKLRTC